MTRHAYDARRVRARTCPSKHEIDSFRRDTPGASGGAAAAKGFCAFPIAATELYVHSHIAQIQTLTATQITLVVFALRQHCGIIGWTTWHLPNSTKRLS